MQTSIPAEVASAVFGAAAFVFSFGVSAFRSFSTRERILRKFIFLLCLEGEGHLITGLDIFVLSKDMDALRFMSSSAFIV